MRAIRTFAVPGPITPISRAAARERSMMRPFTNGPRSLIRTRTVREVSMFCTSTIVPSGSWRCAAVRREES